MPKPLAAGDILVTSSPWPGHAGIALFDIGLVPDGLIDTLRTRNQRLRADTIAHAVTGQGVEMLTGWHQKSTVYRPKTLDFALIEELWRIAEEIQRSANYGMARAVLKSWSRSMKASNNSQARLDKYRQRLQDHQGRPQIVKNVYCSEFVVLCYQLACPNDQHPAFLNINAKHTLPGQLGDWLKKRPAHWERLGRTSGDSSLEYD